MELHNGKEVVETSAKFNSHFCIKWIWNSTLPVVGKSNKNDIKDKIQNFAKKGASILKKK